MCKLQHTFVVFIIYFNLDFTGILCRPLCYEHGRKSHIAIMELSPSCTYTPAECSQTKDPASTSIILEWKIKVDTQRNCICSPLLFPMSLTHCLWKHEEGNHMQRVWPVNRSHLTSASHMLFPAKKHPWKAVAKSSTEQRLSTGTLPCLTLDLHPWQLFLAAVLGFPLNCKVSLSGYFYAFFPSALCSDFMLLCCLSSFLVFQSCYWLLIQEQNKLIPSQFAWRRADDCSVNRSRKELSARCPSNIQAARHILCNKNTVQTTAGFNWKIRCSVILDGWFSANYKVGWAPLESQQCLTNPSLQVI